MSTVNFKPYGLTPVDTLFFRDARPMEAGAGSGGHGARWPLPTVVCEALRTALLRAAGEITMRRERPGHLRPAHNGRRQTIFTDAFRSLTIRGPFPARQGNLYMPRPIDLVLAKCTGDETKPELLRPGVCGGQTNLPVEWLHPVEAKSRIGKEKPPEWIPLKAFRECLAGSPPEVAEIDPPLFDSERRIGVEIDDDTGAAKDGQLYSSEHLRLAHDVTLWFEAGLSPRCKEENRGMDLSAIEKDIVSLGGESRMARMTEADSLLDIPAPTVGTRVKWVLATHAVFNGGWRPSWVSAVDGRLLMKEHDVARHPDENRKEWRERIKKDGRPIGAKLVAACVDKPIFFSGWDLGWMPAEAVGVEDGIRKTEEEMKRTPGGPKPTLLAAPAGSVYYFESDTEEDAQRLVQALHGRTRSDVLGEKGLGLGYCGVWGEH